MPKLLDQVREVIRIKNYIVRTEQAYVEWIKRYIFFHNKRQRAGMVEPEFIAFISDLANKKQVIGEGYELSRSRFGPGNQFIVIFHIKFGPCEPSDGAVNGSCYAFTTDDLIPYSNEEYYKHSAPPERETGRPTVATTNIPLRRSGKPGGRRSRLQTFRSAGAGNREADGRSYKHSAPLEREGGGRRYWQVIAD